MENQKISIRDINDTKWFKMDNEFIDEAINLELEKFSIVIYTLFCYKAKWEDMKYSISINSICSILNCSRHSVVPAINILIESELIKKDGNDYYLIETWKDWNRDNNIQSINRSIKKIEKFFFIDNLLFRNFKDKDNNTIYFSGILGVHATAMYIVLCKYANWNTQISFPSLIKESGEGICKILNMSRPIATRSIKILEFFNMIKVERKKGKSSNTYTMINKKNWNFEFNQIKLNNLFTKKT